MTLIEDRRLKKITVGTSSLVVNRAAGEQTRAFLFTDVDVTHDLFARCLIDQRSHLDAFVEAVADFDFPRALDKHVDSFFGHVAVHDEPAGRGAALSGGAESAPQRAFDGEIEIGIFHDDLRILAADLERQRASDFDRRRGDLAPDGGRTGKGNQLHVAMTHQRGAHFLTAPMNQIDNPRRHAGLVEDLDESCGGMRRIFRRL